MLSRLLPCADFARTRCPIPSLLSGSPALWFRLMRRAFTSRVRWVAERLPHSKTSAIVCVLGCATRRKTRLATAALKSSATGAFRQTEPARKNQMNVKPYQDNVLIQFQPRASTTASGIHIPQTVTESRVGTREAKVLAVGPGHHGRAGQFIPTQVKAGETVLVDALAGQDYSMDLSAPRHNKATEWDADGGALRMVREQEILCVVERDQAAVERDQAAE